MLNPHALKVLYYTQIHSILQYGIVLWGNMINKSQIKKLQKLQNISVRQIDSRKHTEEIYRLHKIPKIEQIITIENTKLWHKQQTKQLPPTLQRIMTEDHTRSTLLRLHRYPTRNKCVPKLPGIKNSSYQKSLFVKGLADYQKLPLETRQLKDCKQFIKKTKEVICKHD